MTSADEIIAQTIGRNAEGVAELGGVIKVDVEDSPDGPRYLDLATGTVSPTGQPTAIVRGQYRDLVAFLAGEMSMKDGLLTGRLHLAGDPGYLSRLARALTTLRERDSDDTPTPS